MSTAFSPLATVVRARSRLTPGVAPHAVVALHDIAGAVVKTRDAGVRVAKAGLPGAAPAAAPAAATREREHEGKDGHDRRYSEDLPSVHAIDGTTTNGGRGP